MLLELLQNDALKKEERTILELSFTNLSASPFPSYETSNMI